MQFFCQNQGSARLALRSKLANMQTAQGCLAAASGIEAFHFLSGSNLVASEEEAMEAAASTGYPILLKATGGGGGIGIYICHTPEEVKTNFAASVR